MLPNYSKLLTRIEKENFLKIVLDVKNLSSVSDKKIDNAFSNLLSVFMEHESNYTLALPKYTNGISQLKDKYFHSIDFTNESLENLKFFVYNKPLTVKEITSKTKLENIGYQFGRYGNIYSPPNQPNLSVNLFTVYREEKTNEMLPHYTFTGHCYVDLLNQYNILKTLDSGNQIHVRV